MDESDESTDKLLSVDDLENPVILQSWFPNELNHGAGLDSGYDGMNYLESQIDPYPLYSSKMEGLSELNDPTTKLLSVDDFENQIILLPWYPSESEGHADYNEIDDLYMQPVPLQSYVSDPEGDSDVDMQPVALQSYVSDPEGDSDLDMQPIHLQSYVSDPEGDPGLDMQPVPLQSHVSDSEGDPDLDMELVPLQSYVSNPEDDPDLDMQPIQHVPLQSHVSDSQGDPDLDMQPVPLQCYMSDTEDDPDFHSYYDSRNQVIILPWYPDEVKGVEKFDTDNDGVKDSETEATISPWHQSPTKGSGTLDEASTSASPQANLVSEFVGMGFAEKMVRKTLEENGEANTELILEILLAHPTLHRESGVPKEPSFDFYDLTKSDDTTLEDQENIEHISEKDRNLSYLLDMGFAADEALSAIDASGPDTSMADLMDFIYAFQASRLFDDLSREAPRPILDDDETPATKKRKFTEGRDIWKRNVERASSQKKKIVEGDFTIHFPRNMIGFGVPEISRYILHRNIPEAAVGPPYFYYENVAFAPKEVWPTISRFLFEIEPEFVDSSHFCAAARKRGYIHNLPIQNRFQLQPIPPLTVQEAFPFTKEWWPSWDDRKKLNCLTTSVGSGKLVEKLGDILQRFNDTPPIETRKYILYECRKSNLIWVGKNKLATLEPDEMELILGYPNNHTRGGGMNRGDRYKSLGNTFQVDTVAYHLSVLKSMFPEGMNVLSLFSGIGGAEVALHRLGIPLKNVVSVEILEGNRNIIRSWWEQTKQKGNLIELKDVQELSIDKLKHYIDLLGGFDLVIGGSPCNNISGKNRVSRDGLQGEHSILFYDYFRILKDVKVLMGGVI